MGLSDLGGALSWGEAILLIEQYAGDTGTALGAKLAGWAYAASMPELISLMAQIGNQKAAHKVMPWVMKDPHRRGPQATPDEVATATAELEDGIVFS